jgi:DNA-directed RNA polymerase specialized sigma24 family protein
LSTQPPISYVGRLGGPIALQDGPDAAQEALIAVFRGLGQLREPAALFGWVRAIAVREAVRVARRGEAGRTVAGAMADVPAPGDPQLATDVRDVLERLAGSFRLPGLRFLRPLLAPLERRVGRMVLRRLEARVHAR